MELMVAIAIIGLLAAVVVPNLRRSAPRQERQNFISQLNNLASFAWQKSITTGKTCKVHFDFGKKEISLEIADKQDKYGKMQYGPIKRAYVKTSIKILDQLELKNFYIEGEDKAGKVMSGRDKGTVYFLVSDGLSQAVVINFVDKKDKVGRKARRVGLVLNPFWTQFEEYDEFKRP